jgi:hypothetical protein
MQCRWLHLPHCKQQLRAHLTLCWLNQGDAISSLALTGLALVVLAQGHVKATQLPLHAQQQK